MVNLSLEILFGMLPSAGKYYRRLFEDKDLTICQDGHPNSPQPKPEEPQEDYSKIILTSQIIKMTLL